MVNGHQTDVDIQTDRQTDSKTDRTRQTRQTNALDNLLDCYKCTEIGRGVTNVVQGKTN